MSEESRPSNESPTLVPPARSLDLEYSGRPDEPDHGIEATCRNCGHGTVLPFAVTLQAWDLLVKLISEATDISRRGLLDDSGVRPGGDLLQARALLVQALFRIAGETGAYEWLRLQGWSTRRVRLAEELKLTDEYQDLLEAVRPALMLA